MATHSLVSCSNIVYSETANGKGSERSAQLAKRTGLEPSSLRQGNQLTACELWSQSIEWQSFASGAKSSELLVSPLRSIAFVETFWRR